MERVIDMIINKIIWPLLTILGLGMLSRLWVGHIFRSQVSEHKDFMAINKAYSSLVWNEIRRPESHKKAYPTVPYLGQFCWDEIRAPLRLCIYSFWKRKDRQAIRRFLEFEADFKEQPNYLELEIDEQADAYGKYIIKHLWCYDLMSNFGKYGTNNFNYDGTNISAALPFKYGITLDKTDAFNCYLKDNGIKTGGPEQMNEILKEI